jgi:hypothetical protein
VKSMTTLDSTQQSCIGGNPSIMDNKILGASMKALVHIELARLKSQTPCHGLRLFDVMSCSPGSKSN